ncbi:MAG: beta-N-acetylhexosaminidase [Anaerolineales bacterium]|nr:beta-N-acetylhexosaminidase [Anaerolineales bacterium]
MIKQTFFYLLLLSIIFAACQPEPVPIASSPPQAASLTNPPLSTLTKTATSLTNLPLTPTPVHPPIIMTTSPFIENTLSALTLEQKIGQVMIIGLDGTTVDPELRQMIAEYHVGGIILFARNVQSPAQVAQLTNQLQTIARESGHPGLFIAVDQEAGRVARLTGETGFTEFPSAMALTAIGDPQNARQVAAAMALEMRAVGINVDFAPDLDVNNNPSNPVIGIRSFSSDPQKVVEYGLAFAKGLQENGVLAVGKHFPGHGDTSVDSHIDLPLVPHDRARLDQIELVPFRAAIEADIAGIMSAHVTFPAIDDTPGLAATLSRPVLTGLLRNELGYNGLIFTDSLEMGALAANGYPPQVGAPLALAAGADLLLFNRDHAMHREAFANLVEAVRSGKIAQAQLDDSVRRILAAKQRYGILTPVLVDAEAASSLVKTSEHLNLAANLAARSITLIRDPQALIPLDKSLAALVLEAPALRGQASGFGSTILAVDSQPTRSQIADVIHAARGGRLVIFPVYDLALNPQQQELIQQLIQAGNPVIAIVCRNPFDIVRLPQEVTVLVSYGFNFPAREALKEILAGTLQPIGVLPVDLP